MKQGREDIVSESQRKKLPKNIAHIYYSLTLGRAYYLSIASYVPLNQPGSKIISIIYMYA